MTITIEQIKAAYEQTGATPIAGEFHTFDGTTHECCLLSVLYLEKFGADNLDQALLEREGAFIDPIVKLSHDLELDPRYARGIIDGFDALSGTFSRVLWSESAQAEYERGYELGKQARTVFIEEA